MDDRKPPPPPHLSTPLRLGFNFPSPVQLHYVTFHSLLCIALRLHTTQRSLVLLQKGVRHFSLFGLFLKFFFFFLDRLPSLDRQHWVVVPGVFYGTSSWMGKSVWGNRVMTLTLGSSKRSSHVRFIAIGCTFRTQRARVMCFWGLTRRDMAFCFLTYSLAERGPLASPRLSVVDFGVPLVFTRQKLSDISFNVLISANCCSLGSLCDRRAGCAFDEYENTE